MKEQKKLVEIKNIEIQIGKKSLTLSPEEARDLKEALDKLYPSPKVIRESIPYPYPVYPKPYTDPWWRYTWYDNTSTVAPLTVGDGVAPLTFDSVSNDAFKQPFYSSDNVTCYCSAN